MKRCPHCNSPITQPDRKTCPVCGNPLSGPTGAARRRLPPWVPVVLLCAVAAVGLFVLGMSLTLMIKGHHIDSEISTNKNMQRLGIKCAVHETREADGGAGCSDTHSAAGCSGNCSACDIEQTTKKEE